MRGSGLTCSVWAWSGRGSVRSGTAGTPHRQRRGCQVIPGPLVRLGERGNNIVHARTWMFSEERNPENFRRRGLGSSLILLLVDGNPEFTASDTSGSGNSEYEPGAFHTHEVCASASSPVGRGGGEEGESVLLSRRPASPDCEESVSGRAAAALPTVAIRVFGTGKPVKLRGKTRVIEQSIWTWCIILPC